MISLTINQGSMLSLLERLDAASLPPAKRRRIMQLIGREVAKVNRQRIKAGKAPDGTSWAPIKSQREDKKLTGLSRRLRSRGSADEATIQFDTRFTGMIAKQLHTGTTRHYKAKDRAPKRSEKGVKRDQYKPTDDPCTRKQAIRLHECGFTVSSYRGSRVRPRTPSVRWMQKHISKGRAGIILRTLYYHRSGRKEAWVVNTPARPMMQEASNEEMMTIAAKAFKKMGWGGKS